MYVGVCVSCLRIQHLCVCTTTSLEAMYSVGYCTNIRMCVCVFPAFIMQHMWVCTTASLQEMYSIGFRGFV